MKQNNPVVLLLGSLLALVTADPLSAQSTKDAPPDPSADAIELSPFIVAAGEDKGYRASSTLAGTRLRTDLKNVAASISVVTKDFMQDIGVNNLDDLLPYTLGTEVAGLGGNFSDSTRQADFTVAFVPIRSVQGSNRVRGLGSADQTRDYFPTMVPMDGYNTDRVEVNRGPNAMLFGLGSAAGIINTGLIKAQTNKIKTKVEGQYGQHGTGRVTLDHNQVLIKDRLALRVATLHGDRRYQQEPAYVRDARYFLTATWRPWKGATIKASTESAKQFSNKVTVTPPDDKLTPWFAMGKPVYDPTTGVGTYLGIQPTDPNIRPLAATGVANGNLLNQWDSSSYLIMENPNVTRFGVTGLDPAIMGYEGSNNRVHLDAAGTAFVNDGMRSIQFGKNFIQRLNQAVHPEWFIFWKDFKITDPSIFPFYDQMLSGPNKREWAFWKTYNVSFEQRLGANAGVEFAFDKQFMDFGFVNPFENRFHAVNIDINTKLPNGLPNPNLGRPFVVGPGFQGSTGVDLEAARATAYYNLDFARGKEGWLKKLLGKHIFTGSFTSQDRRGESFFGRPYFLGLDHWQSESANETRSIAISASADRLLPRQTYLGPSLLGAAGPQGTGLQGVQVNNGIDGSSNFTTLYYQTPAAAPVAVAPWQTRTFSVIQSDQYDLRRTAFQGTSRNRNKVDSLVFVANSHWWDNTVVSTVGWRRDAFKTFDSGNAPIDPSTGLRIYQDQIWNDSRPALDGSATALNYGVVLHQPPFLRRKLPAGAEVSLTYNKADNFRPSAARYDLFNNPLDPPTGETSEYGALVSLFNHKVELRATKYKTRAALATNINFRPFINQLTARLDSQIEANSREDYQAVAPPAALTAWNQWQQSPEAKKLLETFAFKFTPSPNGTIADFDTRADVVLETSDTVASGYEFDLTLNPTGQWRIAFNATRQQTVSSGTGRSFLRMIELLNPVWGGTAASLPNSATNPATLGQQWAGIVANVQKEVLLDGAVSPELRRWRYNMVSNYSFDRGPLKGWRIGGTFRWQDKVAIGYPVRVLPDGSGQYDVKRPFYGPTEQNVDGWIGYSRKLNEKIRWSAQVNVRNIGVGNKLIPVSAQPDGTYDSVRITEAQTWLLTTSFEF